MNILEIASEAAPFVKTGGLGDVLGALPKALSRRGHNVVTIIPRYESITGHKLTESTWEGQVSVAGATHHLSHASQICRKTCHQTWLVENKTMFGRQGIYQDIETGKDFPDNDIRFHFFAKAALECCRRNDFKPDIVHIHDWQAALTAVFLRTIFKTDPFFAKAGIVLTVHNLAYQGRFPAERYRLLELPPDLFIPTAPLEFYGTVNVLKGAITFADRITTVSPRYAEEIQTPEFGCGLEGVLRERHGRLTGILNGADYSEWSPSRDSRIPYHYHPANLSGKTKNKVELMAFAGLPYREKTPLVGMISRLVDQKGLDIIIAAANQLMQFDLQLIVLGVGESKYHQALTLLQKTYPDKVRAYLTFDDRLAHLIEAGSDLYLMPSQFEPCGLNQIYSLKYGTIPVVNKVGGLADTVENVDPLTGQGTGFVMTNYSADALIEAVDRAVNLFSHRRRWITLMKQAMQKDFGWESSAEAYEKLFMTAGNKTA
ncbi:MAG: glycogen synthase GlgA [Candidatus Zixiibacteriota bacterium]|mgnify:CR=1 FL=1